ncbi:MULTISPECIES: ECF transporter S component [unclassified Paenibacillus]|uniref:ECF transporter S component n=1 Tax=unclassified Paenibacillus TaxID=185978 RepID=UPI001C120B98|nr:MULTISPECIES: ECF transporter S component [unclassified Paenibacillus]MBU5440851.1 ECF transporter S component [Paenibacillus sp. MSJ-34]CAH0118450.1 Putative HMP/thiamine permease protein YkoE [Paenibacillus sp. CECT 9249]
MNQAIGNAYRKGLKFSDILVTVFLALVLGVVYRFWGVVYDLFKPFFFQSDEIVYGMWFIASTIAFLIVRKPGVALLAELAAAHVELLFGSEWGIQMFLYGLVQGLCAELVFAAFRYRNYGIAAASLAGVAMAVGSALVDYSYGYIADYEAWMFFVKYGLRCVSSVLITGIFAYYVVKALEATGVTNLVRPVAASEYESLKNEN